MTKETAPGSHVDMQIVSQNTADVLKQVAGQAPFTEQVAVISLLPEDRTQHHRAEKEEAAQLYSTHAVQVMGNQALEKTVYYDAARRQLEAGMDMIQITVAPQYAGAHTVKNLWERVAEQQTAYARRTQSRVRFIGS